MTAAQESAVRAFLAATERPTGAKADRDDYITSVPCGALSRLHDAFTAPTPARRTCRTPYRGGTCGCGCGCDENNGRPEDGTCDCSECRPGNVAGDPKCAECGHATHPPRACGDCGCLWGLPVLGYGLPARGAP